MTNSKPAAEVKISLELVRTLLKEFVPELGDETIVMHSAGWDNEIFRVGSRYAVRLPRRELAAQLVDHEQRWLPELAERLPIDIPLQLHAGTPAFGYPWSWSVVPWFDGVSLAHAPFEPEQLVAQLADICNQLHVEAPYEAPENPYRGVPLAERSESTIGRLQEVHDAGLISGHERTQAEKLWAELQDTPPWGGPPLWLHGDLHPLNMVYRGGQIRALIDFGDLCKGDPATDLAVAWMLFDEQHRNEFRKQSTLDSRSVGIHTWNRARGWALSLSLAYLSHSNDDATMRRIGLTTFRRAIG